MSSNAVKICVPVCVEEASQLAGAIARAAEVADIVELRLDCLNDDGLDATRQWLPDYLKHLEVPVILTLRAADQGGHIPRDLEARRRFWSSIGDLPDNCFADLELDLVKSVANSNGKLPADWTRIICSHHDFAGVPENLESIYEQMAATKARILKIAVQANDAIDCLPIFRLLDGARREGREMIAIAMGQAGIITRVLGPSRGSFLTYGSLDEDSTTAAGQLTARAMREIYRIDQIDSQTQILGLIGRPVSQSISPHIHNRGFAEAGVNAVYIPFEVHDAGQFFRRMVHPQSRELDWNLRGLSVTSPHKQDVISSLDWIEPAAKEIGAVNTIVIQDKELHGYNTDAPGFISPLRSTFGSLTGARCAIIGAGGGARAALWALRNEGARVQLFVRNVAATRLLAEEFGAGCHPLAGADFEGFDVVINATPLGMKGAQQDETPAIAQKLRHVRLAYDLVYNPLETHFLREARAAGCETVAGVEMLVAQAVEQFKLWTGQTPDVAAMRAAASRALRDRSEPPAVAGG